MNPEENFLNKDVPVPAEEVAKSFEAESEKEDELETISEDSLQIIKEERIKDVRKVLEESFKSQEDSRSWKVIFKSRESWALPNAIINDNPFDELKRFFKSFTREQKDKRKLNDKLGHELALDREMFHEISFDYPYGSAIKGQVGNHVGILAKGFHDCSGLVFQGRDHVAILHISPNTIRDASEGGNIVETSDIYGHIGSALKGMLDIDFGQHAETQNGIKLSKEEIEKLQSSINSGEIKVTMLSGEDNLVPSVAVNLAERANLNGLPFMKVDVHYVGNLGDGAGFAIHASPDSLYFIGSNNLLLKKGENLPPTMFDYEKKK